MRLKVPDAVLKDYGPLPEWDLGDLFSGPDGQDIEAAFLTADAQAKDFESRLKGQIATLSPAEFGAAIGDFEALTDLMGKIGTYASLIFSTHLGDPEIGRFYQGTSERLNDISTHLLFFTLEINRLDDTAVEGLCAEAAVARYRPWLRTVRLYRAHELSDELEKLLHEKSVAGRAAWTRLFDETIAALRFRVDGRELTEAECLNLLSDANPQTRKKAAEALSAVFDKNAALFAHITNTLAKDKQVEDRWRRYPTPAASRHLDNQVEQEVVDALVEAVRGSYARISHRYYRIKADMFGVTQMPFWDRNAPLPGDVDRVIRWDEAHDTVINAYRAFDPRMAEIGERFFAEGWIDAPTRPAKAGGAFSHPGVPSGHPYILLNYQGKVRDVMTLAHELGHGVHQVLAAPQGALMAPTPLTLAETASVFGEMLTFQALLGQEDNAANRKFMIAGKVEDMINTVIRQVAFHCFETRIHDERVEGELTPERLGALWLEVQAESLGPAIELSPAYRNYWAYIPHFIHTPFYVYAYAFGDCLVNSLYAAYREAPDGFADRYMEMLRAGGTKTHHELLASFGLDAADPAFWRRGLGVISDLIDQLEAM